MHPFPLPDEVGGGSVNDSELFSLKDHLLSIISKLDRLEGKLDTKADLAQAQALDVRTSNLERSVAEGNVRAEFLLPRFQEMEKDIDRLKEQTTRIDELSTYRRWLAGTALFTLFNAIGLTLQVTLR